MGLHSDQSNLMASGPEADVEPSRPQRRGGRRSTGNGAGQGEADAAPSEPGGGSGPSGSGRAAGGRGRRGEQQLQQHAAGGGSREAQHSGDGSDAIMEAVVKVGWAAAACGSGQQLSLKGLVSDISHQLHMSVGLNARNPLTLSELVEQSETSQKRYKNRLTLQFVLENLEGKKVGMILRYPSN